MALKGVLRPGYIQIRVTDLDTAIKHYVERVGLHEVSGEADGLIVIRVPVVHRGLNAMIDWPMRQDASRFQSAVGRADLPRFL